MATTTKNQLLNLKNTQGDHLLTWLEAFMNDRKAQGFTSGTLHFYKTKLSMFAEFCESRMITQITQITAYDLREYMLRMRKKAITQEADTRDIERLRLSFIGGSGK